MMSVVSRISPLWFLSRTNSTGLLKSSMSCLINARCFSLIVPHGNSSILNNSNFPSTANVSRWGSPFVVTQLRTVSTKQRRRWKVRKYHFKLRLKRTMRKMRVPYVSSKSRGQVKKKPILHDFRPYLRRKLKRAER